MSCSLRLGYAVPLMTLLFAGACASDGPAKDPAPEEAAPAAAEEAAEEAEQAPQDGAPGGGAALPKPCDLIDAELVRKQAGLSAEAPLLVGDMLDAQGVSKDSVSCSWKFGDKIIALQVSREPAGNKFDTWASRMLAAKAEQGFTAVEGLADGGMFKAEESHLLFRHGETWMYSLSYAGDRPGDVMDLATLQPLAASVPKP